MTFAIETAYIHSVTQNSSVYPEPELVEGDNGVSFCGTGDAGTIEIYTSLGDCPEGS